MKPVIAVVVACFFAAVISAEKTACQRTRERQLAIQSSIIIYDCEDNGDYKSLQQYKGSSFKICLYKDGDIVHGPSRNIEQCECFVERYELMKQALSEGNLHPQLPLCERSGYFVSIQTDGTNHWCVDRVTGVSTSDPVPLSTSINCS